MQYIYHAWLLSHVWQANIVLAQLESTVSSLLNQTATYGDNTYVQTWLTPTAYGYTYFWSKDITPTVLGTVYVVINNRGQTKTITSTKSGIGTEYMTNGTLSVLTRTDVNKAGTVTYQLGGYDSPPTILAYPTEYIGADSYITWSGLMSGVHTLHTRTQTCCLPGETSSPTPSHYPYPSSTGTVDSEDPTGWLYNMHVHAATAIGAAEVSSLYAPASIASVMQYCPYSICAISSTDSPASAVGSAPGILKTSTVHITATSSSTTDDPTSDKSSTSPSVLVDPYSRSDSRPAHTAAKPTTTSPVAPDSTVETQTTNNKHTTADQDTTGEKHTTNEKHTTEGDGTSRTTDLARSSTPKETTHRARPPPKHTTTHQLPPHIHHRPTRTITITDVPTLSVSTLVKTVTVTELRTTYFNAPPIVIGSAIVTPNSRTEYVIYSQTLCPGGPPITASGTRYSLGPGGRVLVEGVSTETLTSKTGVGGYIWRGLGGSQTTSATGSATVSSAGSSAPRGSSAVPPSNASSVAPSVSMQTSSGAVKVHGGPAISLVWTYCVMFFLFG